MRPHIAYHNDPNEFSTTSLWTAAYIYAEKIPLLGITFRGRSPIFWFENKGEIARGLSDKFYADMSTPAKSFCAAMSHLKDEVRRASVSETAKCGTANGYAQK